MPIDPDLIPDIPGSDPTKKVILGTSPSTTVTLYKRVNFPANYAHIFYWPNKAKQDEYFNSRPKQKYNNVTYINLEANYIRMGFPIKELKGYVYLSFINENSNYENKTFYYFITGMKSINNNMTEVYISLDVWNTFYFDVAPSYCMIVRQHSKTDKLFESLTPEPIGTGTYITNKNYNTYDDASNRLPFDVMGVAIAQAGTWNGSRVVPFNMLWNYGYLVTHAKLFNFPINDPDDPNAKMDLLTFLNTMEGHFDECIAAAYLYPIQFTLTHDSDYHINTFPNTQYNTVHRDLLFNLENSWDELDGYTPHNYKLYQYPYRLFQVYSADGTCQNYMYEYFKNLSALRKMISFRQYGSSIASTGNGVEVEQVPLHYKNQDEAWDECVKWNMDTPMLLTNNNAKKWWDYNWFKVGLSAIGSAIGIAGSCIGVGSAAVGAAGAASGVSNAANELSAAQGAYAADASQTNAARVQSKNAAYNTALRNQQSANLSLQSAEVSLAGAALETASGFINSTLTANSNPPSIVGSFNASPAVANGKSGIFGRDICLQKADLKRIDTFFDRFGYTVNQIAIPDLSARKVFTYIQTNGCNFTPLPNNSNYVEAPHIAVINSIFDRGTTVWNSEYNNVFDTIGEFNPTTIRNNQVERS